MRKTREIKQTTHKKTVVDTSFLPNNSHCESCKHRSPRCSAVVAVEMTVVCKECFHVVPHKSMTFLQTKTHGRNCIAIFDLFFAVLLMSSNIQWPKNFPYQRESQYKHLHDAINQNKKHRSNAMIEQKCENIGSRRNMTSDIFIFYLIFVDISFLLCYNFNAISK